MHILFDPLLRYSARTPSYCRNNVWLSMGWTGRVSACSQINYTSSISCLSRDIIVTHYRLESIAYLSTFFTTKYDSSRELLDGYFTKLSSNSCKLSMVSMLWFDHSSFSLVMLHVSTYWFYPNPNTGTFLDFKLRNLHLLSTNPQLQIPPRYWLAIMQMSLSVPKKCLVI